MTAGHGFVLPAVAWPSARRTFLTSAGVGMSSGSSARLGFRRTPFLVFENATRSPSCMWSFSKISLGMTTWRRCPTRPRAVRVAGVALLAMSSEYPTIRKRLQLLEQFARVVNQQVGGIDGERFWLESPGDATATDSGIARSLHVHAAVTDHEGLLR